MADRADRDLLLASAESEQHAMERVGPDWRRMAPDEWVARNVHNFPLWGLGEYRYPTPEFDAWMRAVEPFIFDIAGRRALRERFLLCDELVLTPPDLLPRLVDRAATRELGLPRDALVAAIKRQGDAITPTVSTVIRAGDHLSVVAPRHRRPDIEDVFERWRRLI